MESTLYPSEPSSNQDTLLRKPLIFTRGEHGISRKSIDENALHVLYRLSSLGYTAYLVGGGVRDLFLQKKPKDFDVGTDAKPSRLKKVFRNSRIIGRRFRIAHVFFPDGQIIEVATFRRGSQSTVPGRRGPIVRDNEYGTPQEDALRRDLTINGLFYDIDSFSVIDYVGGVQDLKDRIIRTIAPPDPSFREDPVRMIRAQRHASRTGFEIEPNTFEAIERNRHEIRNSNPSRLLEEMLKDLRGGSAAPFFRLMLETQLFDCLLPALAVQLREQESNCACPHPFWRRMETLDRHNQSGASYSAAVLLSVLLHTVLFPDPRFWLGTQNNPSDVWRYLSTNFQKSVKGFRVSRRDAERMAQILITYPKLVKCVESRRLNPTLLKKHYLSEALDFFEVDLESSGASVDFIKEWRRHALPPPEPEARYPFAEGGKREAGAEEGRGFIEGSAPEEGGMEDELAEADLEPEAGIESEAGLGSEAGFNSEPGRPPRRRRRRGGRRRRGKQQPH